MSSQSNEEQADNKAAAEELFSDDFLADFDESDTREDMRSSTKSTSGEELTDSLIGDWFDEDLSNRVDSREQSVTTDATTLVASPETTAGFEEHNADDVAGEALPATFSSAADPSIAAAPDAEADITELVLTAKPGRRWGWRLFSSILGGGLLAVLVIPLALMWGLELDPFGLVPVLPKSLAMPVPVEMQLVTDVTQNSKIQTVATGIDEPNGGDEPGKIAEAIKPGARAGAPADASRPESDQVTTNQSGSGAAAVAGSDPVTIASTAAPIETEEMAETKRGSDDGAAAKPATVAGTNGTDEAQLAVDQSIGEVSVAETVAGNVPESESPPPSVMKAKVDVARQHNDLLVAPESSPPPPIDLTVLENATQRSRDSAAAILAAGVSDIDSLSMGTKQLLVDWYRSLASVGVAWETVDAEAFQQGRDIDHMPVVVEQLYQDIAANETLQISLQCLGPMWLAAASRAEDGVVLLATFEGMRSVGPIWYSTVNLKGRQATAEVGLRHVTVLSRKPFELTIGETVFVTGILLEAGEVWAVDCRSVGQFVSKVSESGYELGD